MVLDFSVKVAEDDTIFIIQSAVRDGKLGELSVDASSITGIPPVAQISTAPPTTTTLKSDGLFLCRCY